nr:unnamed protein product [Callosobruchus analis]
MSKNRRLIYLMFLDIYLTDIVIYSISVLLVIVCDTVFSTFDFYSFYSGRISERSFKCRRCGKAYASITVLKRHFKYECGKLPSVACPICYRLFKRRDNMKRHCFFPVKHEILQIQSQVKLRKLHLLLIIIIW